MAEYMEIEQPGWGKAISKAFIIPQRVILSLMGFLAIVNCYTTRVCLSHVITVLVIRKNDTSNSTSSSETVCPRDDDFNVGGSINSDAIYDWSEQVQGVILGAFYGGYLLTHLPGGILTDIYGGKWVLIVGMTLSGLTSILSPITITAGGPWCLAALRAVMGLGQGVAFPAMGGMLSGWVPASERGKLGALVMGGGILGSIVANSISGVLLHTFSWPFVFIFFGAVTMLWCILFELLCFNYPTVHPYIKMSEVEYLHQELGRLGRIKKPPVPWVGIMTSSATLALISAQIGHDWGLFVIVTDLPKYFSQVLGISVRNNGLYTSFPFVLFWIISILSGFIGDFLIIKHIMSVTNVRKVMTVIAAWGPGLFMVLASYGGCNRTLALSMFILCMGSMGPYFTGMKLSPLDMSPNYSGTIMAISNGLGSLTGLIAPYSVGIMTPNATMQEWRGVFWVAFGMLFFTAIVYIIWGSGEVQPFDDLQYAEKKAEAKAQKKAEKEKEKS